MTSKPAGASQALGELPHDSLAHARGRGAALLLCDVAGDYIVTVRARNPLERGATITITAS